MDDGSVRLGGIANVGSIEYNAAGALNGVIDVVDIYASRDAFAALREDGSVVTWGIPTRVEIARVSTSTCLAELRRL